MNRFAPSNEIKDASHNDAGCEAEDFMNYGGLNRYIFYTRKPLKHIYDMSQRFSRLITHANPHDSA